MKIALHPPTPLPGRMSIDVTDGNICTFYSCSSSCMHDTAELSSPSSSSSSSSSSCLPRLLTSRTSKRFRKGFEKVRRLLSADGFGPKRQEWCGSDGRPCGLHFDLERIDGIRCATGRFAPVNVGRPHLLPRGAIVNRASHDVLAGQKGLERIVGHDALTGGLANFDRKQRPDAHRDHAAQLQVERVPLDELEWFFFCENALGQIIGRSFAVTQHKEKREDGGSAFHRSVRVGTIKAFPPQSSGIIQLGTLMAVLYLLLTRTRSPDAICLLSRARRRTQSSKVHRACMYGIAVQPHRSEC
jgi:hypothetical protein